MKRLAITIVVLLIVSCANPCESDFVESVIESARADTELHRQWIDDNDITVVAEKRGLLVEPRRVLFDYSYGAAEYGYCFSSGAYAYITLATSGSCPKVLFMRIFEPGHAIAEQTCPPQ